MMEETYQAGERLAMLKERTRRCVCKYCGGNLRLKRIIFSNYEEARVDIFCEDCDRIEFGTEPEIYLSAKYFVEETGFNCFADLDDNERTKQMNIAKVCELMSWQDLNLGILDKTGFQVPLALNDHFLGECITLKERDLPDCDTIEDKIAVEGD